MSSQASLRAVLRASRLPAGHSVRASIVADMRRRCQGQGAAAATRAYWEHAALMGAVDALQDLYLRYGIGTQVDQRTKLKRTGALVGFKLPDFADEVEKRLAEEKVREQ